ncbi:MAG: CvpA family protein [Dehalococcoidales bacterium]|jgi:membrane protein required for colicin V production
MNWLDYVLLVIFVISVFMGLRAGIIKVLFTLAGGIIGVVLAGRFAASLGSRFSDSSVAKIVAFIVILIIVMALALLLAFVIKKIASVVLLGWVDRLGGAVFGLVLGAIFCGAIVTMWISFRGSSSAVTDSAISQFLVDKFPLVLGLLPSSFDNVRDFFK